MNERILATVESADFTGRNAELDVLRKHAAGESVAPALIVLSAPAHGASELLKQTYDRMFHERAAVIPIYFAVSARDKTALRCSQRFTSVFLTQTAAFRRGERKILDAAPLISELVAHAAPEDAEWTAEIAASRRNADAADDSPAQIRAALSAPFRAEASGVKFFVMFDDLHETAFFDDDFDFLDILKSVWNQSDAPFVFAGRRRFLYDAAQSGTARLRNAKMLRLEPLGFGDAGSLAEKMAQRFDLPLSEPTRDLIARQFGGVPLLIRFVLQAAQAAHADLNDFASLEKIYADALFGGAIAKYYAGELDRIIPDSAVQRDFISRMHEGFKVGATPAPIDEWQSENLLTAAEFRRTTRLLNDAEIVRLSTNLVEAERENQVLGDYLTARFRLENAAETRAAVVGEMLTDFLKRAPQTLANHYRQSASLDLRGLLAAFNRQETPLALLDYEIFREKYKGVTALESLAESDGEPEKMRLPQIVYTAHTAAFYPPIEQVAAKNRSAVAVGFAESRYTDADEVIWLAAEIDSKLEATAELAEFWCDRLELVALVNNFKDFRLWLIAPEGFAADALTVLRSRSAFGSSRKQAEMLAKFLNVEFAAEHETNAHEYEIVVPMGDDTELITARAVEEIAKRHHFNTKAVNQIKTALVEACINATEHSLSPDRRIYQKFAFEADRLTVTIANRGLLFDGTAREFAPDEGRRGWGLKLMKSLMDEVKFEQMDDGTRLTMTKYLK